MKSASLIILVILQLYSLKNAIAQTGNLPTKTTTRTAVPTGSSVVGVFHGRSPCKEIAKDLGIAASDDCFKLKWSLTLYQDSVTAKPTTYKLAGTPYRKKDREGKWAISKGAKTDPEAIVYILDPDKPQESLFFLKGDDNVLFMLDGERNFRVGNADFSYTLNRVVN